MLALNCEIRKEKSKDGSPGLVVMGGDSRWKVVGSNPGAIYWKEIFNIDLL